MDIAEANSAPLMPAQDPDWQKFLEQEINTGDVVILTDKTFDKVVYNSPEIWIVVFSAEFCKFCKAFAPIYEETSKSLAGKVNFAYVDAISNTDLQKRFAIKSVPKVFYWEPGYFKTDADVKAYKGDKTVDALSEMLLPIHDSYHKDMLSAHKRLPSARWGEKNRIGQDYAPSVTKQPDIMIPIPQVNPEKQEA